MKIYTDNEQIFSSTTQSSSTLASTSILLDRAIGFAISASSTDSTPSAKTFVDGNVTVGTENIAISSHGFLTGLKVQLTNSGGALPTGLSAATDYYVIRVDANNIKLASSRANAVAGTAVDITAAAGGGTHTVTAVSTIAGTIKLQGSLDDSTYFDLSGSSQSISGAGTYMWNVDGAYYKYIRAYGDVTQGQITFSAKITIKGENYKN